MNARRHLTIFLQASLVWLGFWVLGLPDYCQQHSQTAIAIGSIVLTVLIGLSAYRLIGGMVFLRHGRDENRTQRALWMPLYYTLPLAIYDFLYCGLYLGHGAGYVYKSWYISIFYITLWITFAPTAWLLRVKLKISSPTR